MNAERWQIQSCPIPGIRCWIAIASMSSRFEKVPAVEAEFGEAAVAAINRMLADRFATVATLFLAAATLSAATLPDDRVEAMYHSYDGGGVTVNGPAVTASKQISDRFVASADYYVDSISAASIDVITSASPYNEQRTEVGLGFDWLYADALMGLTYSHSDESDYQSDTYGINVAQEVFGGMTTVGMGYYHGDDVVQRVDTDFEDSIDRDGFRIGVSQVLTPTVIAGLDYEAVLEEGYLNNPYRTARVLGAQVPELYPRTRTSQTLAASGSASINRKMALRGRYRFFTDTWDIRSHTFEAGSSHYITPRWMADINVRYYTQDGASFYSDNFDQEYNHMARDKELSTFKSWSAGGRLTWDLRDRLPPVFRHSSFTFSYDYIKFNYDDFTDVRNGDLYEFHSNVFQIYFSTRY
jgi:hypothetical protein